MNNDARDGAVMSRRSSLFRLSAIGLGAAAVAGGGYYAWTKTWGAKDKQPDYVFGAVQRGDIEDLVSATGSLQPRDYVDVGAQVSGQLKKIHVEVGTEVREGDLLAEIDAEQYTAKVDAIRAQSRNQQAQMLEREAQLAQSEQNFQRQKNLKAEDATTADVLLSAETALRVSRAQIAALRAQMEQTESSLRVEEANLKFARIYAPMAGTVVSITARQGQTLNTNQSAPTLLRLADLSTMTVQTQVSEADVSRLWPGVEAYFTTLGSRGRRWTGRLRKIEPTPTVLNNVVLYNALFDVANPTQALMTQMTAQVFFVVASAEDVLLAPMSAVTLARGGDRGGREGGRRRGQGEGAQAASGAVPASGASSPASAASAGREAGEQRRRQRPTEGAGDASQAPRFERPRADRAPGGEAPDASTPARSFDRQAGGERGEGGGEERRRDRARMGGEGASWPADRASGPRGEGFERRRREREQAEGAGAAPAQGGRTDASTRPGDRAGDRGERGANDQRTNDRPTAGRSSAQTPVSKDRLPNMRPPVVRRPVPTPPRKGTVKIVDKDGQVKDREVMIGITNRVQAQILSGLAEGDRIVVGVKQAEQPERKPAGQGGNNNPMGGLGGGLGGGAGGAGGAGRPSR